MRKDQLPQFVAFHRKLDEVQHALSRLARTLYATGIGTPEHLEALQTMERIYAAVVLEPGRGDRP